MEKNNKAVILFSGGIDSTVLLFWLIDKGFEVHPLLINYGQRSFIGEKNAVEKILCKLKTQPLCILDVPQISVFGKGSLVGDFPENLVSRQEWYLSEYFPNRNLILLTLAATYCYKLGVPNLAIGVTDNSYADTKKTFLEGFSKVLELSMTKINILCPFSELPRIKVIEESVRLNVELDLTFSCNSIGNYHCQICNSCQEREDAIKLRQELMLA